MITLDSLWTDYLVLANKALACSEWSTSIADKYSEKTTVKEMYDFLEKRVELSDGWIVWTLQKFGEELSEDVRLRLYDGIKEPMIAFEIYKQFPYITDKEDIKLSALFTTKMPNIHKLILANAVVRNKEE